MLSRRWRIHYEQKSQRNWLQTVKQDQTCLHLAWLLQRLSSGGHRYLLISGGIYFENLILYSDCQDAIESLTGVLLKFVLVHRCRELLGEVLGHINVILLWKARHADIVENCKKQSIGFSNVIQFFYVVIQSQCKITKLCSTHLYRNRTTRRYIQDS